MFGMECNRFAGRKVLLTDAGGGLGPAIARGLVARGAEVIAIDADQAALARLLDLTAGAMIPLATDLTAPGAPVAIARWLADEHGDLTAMICNAAPTPPLVRGHEDGCQAAAQMLALITLTRLLWPQISRRHPASLAFILPAKTRRRPQSGGFLAAFRVGVVSLAGVLKKDGKKSGSGGFVTTAFAKPYLADGTIGVAAMETAAHRLLEAINTGQPKVQLGKSGWGNPNRRRFGSLWLRRPLHPNPT